MSTYCIHAKLPDIKDKIREDEEVVEERNTDSVSWVILKSRCGFDEMRERFKPCIVGVGKL